MLALDLQPFCRQLINVVEFGGTEVAAGRLMNIEKKDVLVVLSFPRYARDAIQLTSYARDRGAHVVALTDAMASPLVTLADDVLLATAHHPVISSSSVAALLADRSVGDEPDGQPQRACAAGGQAHGSDLRLPCESSIEENSLTNTAASLRHTQSNSA